MYVNKYQVTFFMKKTEKITKKFNAFERHLNAYVQYSTDAY